MLSTFKVGHQVSTQHCLRGLFHAFSLQPATRSPPTLSAGNLASYLHEKTSAKMGPSYWMDLPAPPSTSHQHPYFLLCLPATLGAVLPLLMFWITAPLRKPLLSTVILLSPKLSTSLPSWIITISVQISCNGSYLKKEMQIPS